MVPVKPHSHPEIITLTGASQPTIGHRVDERLIDERLTTAIPHGPVPTGIFLVTCLPTTSITETSFEGPLAV